MSIAPQQSIAFSQKEAHLQLANQAIKQGQIQSVNRAARIYKTPRSTLRDRRAEIKARRDCTPNSRLLTDPEEEVLIQYILDLDTRGFAPNLPCVRDMASQINIARGGKPTGTK